jgi:hypothetical protein
VLAGLVQVIHQNSVAKANLQEQRDTPDNAFAIDCCKAAIRHALAAQLTIAAAIPDPEYPADATVYDIPEAFASYQADGR